MHVWISLVCDHNDVVRFAMQVTLAVVIGFVWGFTNPFIKTGSACLKEKRLAQCATKRNAWQSVRLLLTTPSFLVPQVLNVCGSVAFAALLTVGDLSIVAPVANAVSLAANTLVDLSLGERFRLGYLLTGLSCVAIGIALCSSS